MDGFWKGAALVAALWVAAVPGGAQTARPAAPDYSQDANWLCRPGRADACAQDQTATVITADGHMTREAFRPASDPPIDCFYVYPTVSLDPGGNSDLMPGPEEFTVVAGQFARYAARCRTFAPMYRQVTLTSLHARMNGAASQPPDRAMPYADILAAWRHYIAHDNQGRGVVLIGHSQGSVVLTQLVQEEIDGKPAQARLVSAILLGTNVVVPDGADVGGTFQHIPACHADDQTGCVIAYVSFRDSAPPPSGGLFGRALDPLSQKIFTNSHALCTNPADLAGGAGPLHSYFAADFGAWAPAGFSWTRTPRAIDTPFVTTPGLLTGRCVSNGTHTYLAIHVNAGTDDARTRDIPGDVIVDGRLFPDWGLHRIDMHEAIGDLVDIIGRQGAAYAAGRR
ncbi:DUF3089 domain-containing protein [Nitrospirillum viridazoti]|uniref:DUF3089 family protein n=2 Tax=Nitrospirillum TaxID=1543705 RepID=A0A560HMB4_9PROT|nr:DUF3089 domain-containing protein [Nitrospirillum amazonense]TWB47635.1 DUF3089 family protein [Nitrospirillum amazonense]